MNKVLGLICLIFIAIININCGDSKPERPNIIFILSDDHATNAITAYSDHFENIAPTPNIDKIAHGGAILTNAFSTNAICGPSRASIITGKYSHVNKYYKNYQGGYFNGDQWTYPKALQSAGYKTALVGKWHLASEPQGFDYYKYHIEHGEQGVYWNPTYSENGNPVKEEGYATTITTNSALDWLSKIGNKEPFCLLLQYKAPHREWSPEEKYKDLLEDENIPLPDTFYDDYKGREQTAGDTHMTMDFLNRRDLKLTPPDSLEGKILNNWLDYGNMPGQIVQPNDSLTGNELKEWKFQRYIKDYLATVKSVDDNIGRVLNYLKENGLEENTIIVYASDQGFYLGEHGWFDKRFMYEQSLRMPFVIKYPNKIKSGTVINDIVSNIDLAPTVLDLAGVAIPEEVQGKSFLSQLEGKANSEWRQSMYYHYYEYPFWHHVQPHYGIRTDRYKLIHFYYDVDVWEFYDLKNDPNELNNLIESESHQELIKKLKEDLNELKEGYGNNLSLKELREISDTNFGGLESSKKEH
ncbi:MAG: sulfatase [Flavobacteriaceae bacterium]